MFITKDFTAVGTCSLRNQGTQINRVNASVNVEQDFKLFVAGSELELTTELSKQGLIAYSRRGKLETQLRHNLVTVCKIYEIEKEEHSVEVARGIFINLEQYSGKRPTLAFLEAVGAKIAGNIQKKNFLASNSTLCNELIMSLLSNAYEQCYVELAQLDAYCGGK